MAGLTLGLVGGNGTADAGASEGGNVGEARLDQPNGPSYHPSTSADGQYVAYRSAATNLVPNDTNGVSDIFIRDRAAGQTTRVSVSSGGAEANGWSIEPAISPDGKFIAFCSSATNLVPGDTNGKNDVFFHDRVAGTTTRVSIPSAGLESNGSSCSPSLSFGGARVAFRSTANNLVTGDTNAAQDIFVRDFTAKTTFRASVTNNNSQANGPSESPAISGDGSSVAFTSSASNLVIEPDTNGASDVFVRREPSGTSRVSVGHDGNQVSGSSSSPSIDEGGWRVAFESTAAIDPADRGHVDVYVGYDGGGPPTWASRPVHRSDSFGGDSTSPSLSADGRYVAFASKSDHNLTDRNGASDIYEFHLPTETWAFISQDDVYGPGNAASSSPSLSSDGTHMAFETQASNFGVDTNSASDTFLHTWIPDPVTGRLPEGGSSADAETTSAEGDVSAPRHCSLDTSAVKQLDTSATKESTASGESAATQSTSVPRTCRARRLSVRAIAPPDLPCDENNHGDLVYHNGMVWKCHGPTRTWRVVMV